MRSPGRAGRAGDSFDGEVAPDVHRYRNAGLDTHDLVSAPPVAPETDEVARGRAAEAAECGAASAGGGSAQAERGAGRRSPAAGACAALSLRPLANYLPLSPVLALLPGPPPHPPRLPPL